MSNRLFTLYGANARGAFFMREAPGAGRQPPTKSRSRTPSTPASAHRLKDRIFSARALAGRDIAAA